MKHYWIFKGPYVISLLKGSESLQELLKEKLSLKVISKKATTDRVAKREFEDYKVNIIRQLTIFFLTFTITPKILIGFMIIKKISFK